MRPTLPNHHAAAASALPRSSTLPRYISALLAALLIALLAVLAPAGTARAVDSDGPAAPEAGKPWLGATLEWGEDTAAGFSSRLGAVPAGWSTRWPSLSATRSGTTSTASCSRRQQRAPTPC